MTNSETCAGCKYSQTDEDKQTICRRFPPTWALLPIPSPIAGGQMKIAKQSEFPGVGLDQVCGEWTPKIAMADE